MSTIHRTLLFALVAVPIALSAQDGKETTAAQSTLANPFEKGRFYVSTAASWKVEDYDLKDINSFNLEPQAGYFLIDNLAVGIGGVIGLHTFDYLQGDPTLGETSFKVEDTNWGALGPTVRGHIGGPRLSAFAQIGAYFGSIHQVSENNFTADGNVVSGVEDGGFQLYDLAIGFGYYYKRTIGLEWMWHYYYGIAKTTTDLTYDTGETVHYDRSKDSGEGGGASIGLVYLFGLSKGHASPAPVE